MFKWFFNAGTLFISKDQLIRQMSSESNTLALEAVERLKEKSCLQDGTLQCANLAYANLRGVKLARADLRQVILRWRSRQTAWGKSPGCQPARRQPGLCGI